MRSFLNIAWRVAVAVVSGAVVVQLIRPLLQETIWGMGGFAIAVGAAAILLAYGYLLFLLFGIPLVGKIGSAAGGLFFPDDHDYRQAPEYSIAEARVKQGRLEEAVAEFRKVIEKFPEDVFAHLRIADIATERLHDTVLAETELQAALAKARKPDAIVLTAHRLTDLYQHTLRQPARAIEVMESLKSRLPASKHAMGAQQRIETLRELL